MERSCLAILQRVWQESARLKLLNGMPLRALWTGRLPGRALDLSGQRLGDLELQLLLPALEHAAETHGWRCLRRLDLRSNAWLLPPHFEMDGAPTDRTLHAHPPPKPLVWMSQMIVDESGELRSKHDRPH